MGPPVEGPPLSWSDVQKFKSAARTRAAEQLLTLWKRGLGIKSNVALWGDEVEHTLVCLDPESARSTVLLEQTAVLNRWEDRMPLKKIGTSSNPSLQPEWASYMLESVPQKPYGEDIESLLKVESDVKARRKMIQELLHPNQHVITISLFPCLGVDGQFTTPYYIPSSTHTTHSRMLPREICSPITRYPLMELNILSRTGHRAEINVPVFRDVNTPWPFWDRLPPTASKTTEYPPPELKESCIYLDGIGFGSGSCCLQTTFQVEDEPTARWLHDQLIPLGPVMLALTAATPIYKGYLADSDARWNWISASVDDRTPQEKKDLPPRWSPNATYISQDERCKEEYMLPELRIDHDVKRQLLSGGMDERLATHFAYILSWDPTCLSQHDLTSFYADHGEIFNSFQSCVWQHVRLKLPPSGSDDTGWRVEFRPMEIQPQDSENAAFLIFTFLLSRAIVSFWLNLYVPIGKVRESMDVAHERNSVLANKQWFRRRGWSSKKFDSTLELHQWSTTSYGRCESNGTASKGPDYALMTVDEIINGEGDADPSSFPGLISIIWVYLGTLDISASQKSQISFYLDLVSRRASGHLPTPAQWIRSFVTMHPAYQSDSIVHQEICYDLINQIVQASGI